MTKLNKKIEEMKAEGWMVAREDSQPLNGRYYKYAVMVKGEEKLAINHQGSTGGLIQALAITKRTGAR